MPKTNTLSRTGVAIVAISLFLLAYAVAELSGGIRELPGHWWSALPLLGLGLGFGLTAYAKIR